MKVGFSAAGDLDDYVVADTNNNIHRGFYFYKGASLCQNARGEDSGAGASVLRTGLRGALGRQSSDDEPVPVITAPHHNVIANVITNNTAPGVKQWHVHDQALVGRTDNTGKLVFTRYDSLNQITSIPRL